MNKEEVVKFVRDCELTDMYDIFDICRERHNEQMLKDR